VVKHVPKKRALLPFVANKHPPLPPSDPQPAVPTQNISVKVKKLLGGETQVLARDQALGYLYVKHEGESKGWGLSWDFSCRHGPCTDFSYLSSHRHHARFRFHGRPTV
jgi:hypothetical protein